MSDYSAAVTRAEEYARRRQLTFVDQLGSGADGVVFSTDKRTAVKVLRYRQQYENERNVYLRLEELDIGSVGVFQVPRLRSYHDECMVIEVEIVSPPFIVDFASGILTDPQTSLQRS